jgi:uncharacterized protein
VKLHVSDELALPLDWITLATVVYGARGAGKTTFGSVVAEEVIKAKQRFCAVDLKGDWWGLKSSADGRHEGIPVVVFGGDHADLPLEEGAGSFVGSTIAQLAQPAILDLEGFSKGKQVRFLGDFFAALYHENREPILLLLDEAQRYAPQRPISPESSVCLGAVEDLVKLGRKHGIGVVLFTQRGSGLNKEVSEICDMLVAFRTPGPLDQDRVKDWLEANATREQRDQVMGLLASQETGTAVFASGHPGLKLFQVATVRKRETFDSSATPRVGRRRTEPKRLAKPDLEALKTKMAQTVARAKANDPKELRRQVAELKAQLAKAATRPPPAESPPKRVEVQVMGEKQLRRLESFAKDLDGVTNRITNVGAALGTHLKEFLATLKRAIAPQAKPQLKGYQPAHPPKNPVPPRGGTGVVRPPAPKPSVAYEELGKGERIVLQAVAQHTDGATAEQIAVLTGYRRSSRGKYLQKLGVAGLVVRNGLNFLATDAGISELGAEFQPLPKGEALRRSVRRIPRSCTRANSRRVPDTSAQAVESTCSISRRASWRSRWVDSPRRAMCSSRRAREKRPQHEAKRDT